MQRFEERMEEWAVGGFGNNPTGGSGEIDVPMVSDQVPAEEERMQEDDAGEAPATPGAQAPGEDDDDVMEEDGGLMDIELNILEKDIGNLTSYKSSGTKLTGRFPRSGEIQDMEDELGKYNKDVGEHVMEIYAPPRVTKMAERMNMIPGLALDLSTLDPEDGQPWDFKNEDKRRKAEEMVRDKRALLVIGSPMCTTFSRLQHMNFSRMTQEQVKEVQEHGRKHLEFCITLYINPG